MKQYVQIDIFDEAGRFNPSPMEKMLKMNRDHFFIFFPRQIRLKEITKLREWLMPYENIRFCIHDKTLLQKENEAFLGRNLAFISIINRKHPHVENISYHMGPIAGFGIKNQKKLLERYKTLETSEMTKNEKFFCSLYSVNEYRDFFNGCAAYLKRLAKAADDYSMKILIKNLSMDYILADRDNAADFLQKGYRLPDPENPSAAFPIKVPLLIEKGDFPRHLKETAALQEEYNTGIALDLENLRYISQLSKRYNLNNTNMTDLWEINITPEERRFINETGFIIKPGKPVFFEKEIDIYDQILSLENTIEIAHLSGSIGPVFIDKKMLQKEDITNDVLLGILEKDRGFAVCGRNQLASFDGYNEQMNQNNFKYPAAQNIWKEIFKTQFLEDITLLKEIHCGRIIQKMKNFSENASETFHLFENLTDMEIT